uniref:Uncharacterized protein n=1 Tax=Candidatus Kentrum sp. TUN TaxID=2126343 RepID=A0A450ZL69_9GAMM|nr:MAG: hypothetical protein BECKTUN1418E_GA0071001_100518 [Candidatus Kentron sp. TUN]VFK51343.1 MAG: hypothetical protein BECKTUN1418D_GA0071000_100717 [Candidatus Kentron sp. TUN]VFK54468.1 MAG: hypothetical protein BECKTUN1418F_GA0071002_10435 [Candidatus Kentron sp. TUN]
MSIKNADITILGGVDIYKHFTGWNNKDILDRMRALTGGQAADITPTYTLIENVKSKHVSASHRD